MVNLSQTLSQTSRHVEMVCVHDFPRGSRGSFGESRRNGIWATVGLLPVLVNDLQELQLQHPTSDVTHRIHHCLSLFVILVYATDHFSKSI